MAIIELNEHQQHEVDVLVQTVRTCPYSDPGVREEKFLQALTAGADIYGDFSEDQVEAIFYEHRKEVLDLGHSAVDSQSAA